MDIEKEIFKKARVKEEALLPYGFRKEGEDYLYEKEFMDGSFRADIMVKKDGSLSGKVIDLAFDDEYRNFRIENQAGAFVNQVREEYSSILLNIRDHCYSTVFFTSDQANRVSELIKRDFGNELEFPFVDDPIGVFRHPATEKWYGVIMDTHKDRIIKGAEGDIEIINLKLDPEEIQELLKRDHFYPAYHMNKKYWITLPLDDSLDDEAILPYVHKSREIVSSKKK